MSQTASNYERIEGDKYFTPRWVTEALLPVETFNGGVWDPAAGAGHILDALPEGTRCHGSDIEPDAKWIEAADFFDARESLWPNILTNPPYGTGNRIAIKFIEHALRLTKPHGGKVAMLVRVDFDSAGGRRRLFADHPAFAAKYVLTRRIRWANIRQVAAGPSENHCWMVWDWRRRPGIPVTIGYLPIEGAEQ